MSTSATTPVPPAPEPSATALGKRRREDDAHVGTGASSSSLPPKGTFNEVPPVRVDALVPEPQIEAIPAGSLAPEQEQVAYSFTGDIPNEHDPFSSASAQSSALNGVVYPISPAYAASLPPGSLYAGALQAGAEKAGRGRPAARPRGRPRQRIERILTTTTHSEAGETSVPIGTTHFTLEQQVLENQAPIEHVTSGGDVMCPHPGCGKIFPKSRSYNLRSHLRSHIQIKPFQCLTCSRAFSRKHDLERHSRKHVSRAQRSAGQAVADFALVPASQTGDKPYFCDYCAKTFARSDLLRRHWHIQPACGEKAAAAGAEEMLERQLMEAVKSIAEADNSGVAAGQSEQGAQAEAAEEQGEEHVEGAPELDEQAHLQDHVGETDADQQLGLDGGVVEEGEEGDMQGEIEDAVQDAVQDAAAMAMSVGLGQIEQEAAAAAEEEEGVVDHTGVDEGLESAVQSAMAEAIGEARDTDTDADAAAAAAAYTYAMGQGLHQAAYDDPYASVIDPSLEQQEQEEGGGALDPALHTGIAQQHHHEQTGDQGQGATEEQG